MRCATQKEAEFTGEQIAVDALGCRRPRPLQETEEPKNKDTEEETTF